jgi:prepilin-type N-terminal cleavage/methylation domain-containing protein
MAILKNDKGFTFSELMLASLILAVVLTALLTLFTNCKIITQQNRDDLVAVNHAEYILEDIKAASFPPTVSDWNLDTDDLSGPPYNFTTLTNETVSVTSVDKGTSYDLLEVNVTVSWNDLKTRRSRNFVLSTLITDM